VSTVEFRRQNKIAFPVGRRYDHNFLRFSPISSGKIGVLLKKQYEPNFAKASSFLNENRTFFRRIFSAKIFSKSVHAGRPLCQLGKLTDEK
jgi:hypothetical protein